jgi:hypothetical protein
VCIGFVWLRIGTSENSCECGNEPSGPIKCREVLECLNNWRPASSAQLHRITSVVYSHILHIALLARHSFCFHFNYHPARAAAYINFRNDFLLFFFIYCVKQTWLFYLSLCLNFLHFSFHNSMLLFQLP